MYIRSTVSPRQVRVLPWAVNEVGLAITEPRWPWEPVSEADHPLSGPSLRHPRIRAGLSRLLWPSECPSLVPAKESGALLGPWLVFGGPVGGLVVVVHGSEALTWIGSLTGRHLAPSNDPKREKGAGLGGRRLCCPPFPASPFNPPAHSTQPTRAKTSPTHTLLIRAR